MAGSANTITQCTAAGMLKKLTMTKYEISISLAAKWHAGQKYGDAEYIEHLYMVDRYLKKYYASIKQPANQEVLITGILHDILEDTKMPRNHLEQFGWNVYWDVVRLSKIKSKPNYYKQISESENATIVKFADRICNLKASINGNNYRMMRKYLNEKKPFLRLYSEKYKYFCNDLNWLYFRAWIKLTFKSLSTLIQ